MSTAKKNKPAKTFRFAGKLRGVLLEKYGNGLGGYGELLTLFENPRELIVRDRNGQACSRGNKNYKVERAFEELVDELSVEEKKALIPLDKTEAEDMRAFAQASGTGGMEDSVWRRISGYGNWNWELIGGLARYFHGQRMLEIMAGNGLFSYMLMEKGLSVIATDIAPGKNNDYVAMRDGNYCDVRQTDALGAIRRYGQNADVLICSWPPEGEEPVQKAASAFFRLHPDGRMLYVGEWKGGVNATDAFFDGVAVADPLNEINALHVRHIGSKDVIRLLKQKE